ncbi:hypothetical protein BDN70DRAFT_704659 [Pholiota conissans]|uniref:Uncharacterized protein n=1 Tax=Pholiota conissans TaxID=109636 RepID=A0A9P5ZCM5_9AGAR|nr:hypothetical protein BDN70DRAFT_704659 [Pholiota conissans]
MLSPGRMGASQDVEFPTYAETSIDPPSAALLGLHAAYAKVLHACGDPTRELVRTFGEKAVRYQQMLDDLRFNGREHPWKGDDLLTDTPIIL